jgi:hypothetical protein
MNKIFLLPLIFTRKVYKNLFRARKPPVMYAGQEASDIIYDVLAAEKPCMIARFGSVELNCLTNYLSISNDAGIFRKAVAYITGKSKEFWWTDNTIKTMNVNAGFFPPKIEEFIKFSNLMLDCMPNMDILASWRPEEKMIKDRLSHCKTIGLIDFDPYLRVHPWTKVLEGKNILVIHPFSKSIEVQYKQRENLFSNKDMLPEFHLETITAVQSIGNNHDNYPFSDWFSALAYMKDEIRKRDFDIAIIGCGAYGFPLASFVKDLGKKAVHLGGSTQLLFGIKGKRWDDGEYGRLLYNEHWIRPSQAETPMEAHHVEGACYW